MSKKLKGTYDRPRLYIFRSNKHIYAQVIDDIDASIMLSVSSLSPEIRILKESSDNYNVSQIVGQIIAEKCLKKGIHKVVFDRGSKLYHGRIKILADSARQSGILF